MELRQLGRSGLEVPVLGFGTGTFGGSGPLFGEWGTTEAAEAGRLVDICLDAGVTLFDTSDAYSGGASEEVLGRAVRGRRDKVLISTKTGLSVSVDPSDFGASSKRLGAAVDRSLKRLGTDYIDLLQFHALDVHTPVEEQLGALEALITEGKVRHVGVSNYPAWQLMKALAVADRLSLPRFCAHQVYYSLVGRDYEADLMPLGHDQDVSALVWSPLAWGRLTGKIRRNSPLPATSRLHRTADLGPAVDEAQLYVVIDVLERVALECGRTVPQVALNWLLGRPTVASVIIGARSEEQLRDNLGAAGWSLSAEHRQLLDAAGAVAQPYPHSMYRSGGFAKLNPPLI